MARPRKPARLWLNPQDNKWVIRDGKTFIRTGCAEADLAGAEAALSEYTGRKYNPSDREHSPAKVTVGQALRAYAIDHAKHTKDPARIAYAIDALMSWWEGKTLMDVRGSNCRAYADYRRKTPRGNHADAKTAAKRDRTVSDGTIRRELGVLSSAIGHWHKEHGPLDSVPVVSLPQKPEPKPDVLDRSEMARLLAGALGFYTLQWSDIATRQMHRKLKRDHSWINRHLARFIVIGRYTANRPGATLGLMWMPNTTGGWPDFKRELLYRKGQGVAETSKRQPSVRLGQAALAHFKRWKATDDKTGALNVIAWNGKTIGDIGRSWRRALDYAGLPAHYTPHILRHTRVTWWVEAGLPIEEVATAAGMTAQMVEEVYWHRSPHFQKRAAEA